MRALLLTALIACGPRWQEKTTVEPESDSTHEQPTIEQPPQRTATTMQRSAPTSGGPPPAAQLCAPGPNAMQAKVRVSSLNRSSIQTSLCDAADAALGRLSYLSSLIPGGFHITVELKPTIVQNDMMFVNVGIYVEGVSGMITRFADIAGEKLGSSVQPWLMVHALVERLVEREVGPTMQQHVPGRLPAP